MKTTAGVDYISAVLGSASSTGTGAYAPANYVAVSANTTAPAAGDTTVAGEITTAGGGLVRGVGVFAHTAGASTYTVTRTLTANGSDALPVTLAKVGILNAASAGTLVYESLLSPTVTLNSSGDSATITETVTIS